MVLLCHMLVQVLKHALCAILVSRGLLWLLLSGFRLASFALACQDGPLHLRPGWHSSSKCCESQQCLVPLLSPVRC